MKARHSLRTEREGVKCKEWHQKLDQYLGYIRPGQVLIISGVVLYT